MTTADQDITGLVAFVKRYTRMLCALMGGHAPCYCGKFPKPRPQPPYAPVSWTVNTSNISDVRVWYG